MAYQVFVREIKPELIMIDFRFHCTGQSNMVFGLHSDMNADSECQTSDQLRHWVNHLTMIDLV